MRSKSGTWTSSGVCREGLDESVSRRVHLMCKGCRKIFVHVLETNYKK